MSKIRFAIAVLGGIVAAGAAIAVVEAVGHARLSGAPLFALVAAGYGLGAAVGTGVARWLTAGPAAGIVVTLALAALAVINLFQIAHPFWFLPLAAATLFAGWWTGDRMGRRTGA
jgi:hypothetical protein